MARRSRRISSSLLPENMGPQMTSIHPTFPVMMSMNRSECHNCRERSKPGSRFVHPLLELVERSREKVIGRFDPYQALGFGNGLEQPLEIGARRKLVVSALEEDLGHAARFE